mgnify:CR=1 FL=1
MKREKEVSHFLTKWLSGSKNLERRNQKYHAYDSERRKKEPAMRVELKTKKKKFLIRMENFWHKMARREESQRDAVL